jgi:putative ABC transport system permease protein
MMRHYVTAAMRSLAQHRLYTLLNVAGLSIGFASSLLILLYVRDQLSYDKWIPDTAHLYRLEATFHPPGRKPIRTSQCPFPVLTAVGEQIPQVRAVTHAHLEQTTVTVAGREFNQTATVVDPNFLEVIRLPLLQGNRTRALAQPESVVLSRKLAREYFGAADPVGKVIQVSLQWDASCQARNRKCLDAVYPLTVTGVLQDLPHDTQLRADMVIPDSSRADSFSRAWKDQDPQTTHGAYGYVELATGAHPSSVLAALGPILNRLVNPGVWGIDESGSQFEQYHLTPFTDVHLTSDRHSLGGMKPGGSWNAIYGLSSIAVLILLVAAFNFVNLSTARASLRAREIAVRKISGARRRQLIAQLLLEALLVAGVSLVLALSAVELLLPAYDRFLREPIAFHYLSQPGLLGTVTLSALAVGLASGIYPAFVISGYRPAAALKAGPGSRGSGLLRGVLVVAQFAVSIALAIAVLVVLRQIDYARNLDLGFRRQGVLVIRGIYKLTPSARQSLARALRADSQIRGVAYSDAVPFDVWDAWTPVINLQGHQQRFTARLIDASPQFPSLYGMRLLAGRLLSSSRGADVSASSDERPALINEEAARRFGLGIEQAVGRTIAIPGLPVKMRIVGVLADAKLDGLTRPVGPEVYYSKDSVPLDMSLLSVRIGGARISDALAYIDRTWRSFAPHEAIDRYFLSEAFQGLFRRTKRQGEALGFFGCVAIFIACLGLFGLSVFTAERRTKEIGLRKVSGAKSVDILGLMLWRVSLPVLLANAVAWPVTWYFLRAWLAGYAYRIELTPIYFLAGAAGALAVAAATVFAHTLHMARTSPVCALRYE